MNEREIKEKNSKVYQYSRGDEREDRKDNARTDRLFF